MSRADRRNVAAFLAGGVGGAIAVTPAVLAGAARIADQRLNRTVGGRHGMPEPARSVHRRQPVADLHTDALLWPRDLLRLHRRGHVDVPRLVAGNVGLQVFSVVTQAPSSRDLSTAVPAGAPDPVKLLSMAAGRPRATWRSLLARALEQAERLHDAAARSAGLLRVVRSGDDMREGRCISALLAVEGLHAAEGDPDNIDVLFDAGFRMFGLVHLADNDVAGSSTGTARHGLTDLGREMVERVERRGGLVDLAHASAAAIDDVLGTATRPVVVSHTGVRATVDTPRNLSDEHVEGVAATGGVIGIGLWPGAVGAAQPAATVRAIRHVAGLVGVEHVAVGSDFDGTVTTPFDASGWAGLTAAVLAGGFSENETAQVMGGNATKLLRAQLPEADQKDLIL